MAKGKKKESLNELLLKYLRNVNENLEKITNKLDLIDSKIELTPLLKDRDERLYQ